MERRGKMRVGLDYHGVIDCFPRFFSKVIRDLRQNKHEVHILTGEEITAKLMLELLHFDIIDVEIFSITSYHKSLGTPMTFKSGNPNHPLIEDELWDRSKADYCKRQNIDIHIDDSLIYGKYFVDKTQYVLYNSNTIKLLNCFKRCI